MKKSTLAGLIACLGVTIAFVGWESPAHATGAYFTSDTAFYGQGGPDQGVDYYGCDWGPNGTTVYIYWSTVSQYDCEFNTPNSGGTAVAHDGGGPVCSGNMSGSFSLPCDDAGDTIYICGSDYLGGAAYTVGELEACGG
jgi:hypothetical protein